MRGIVSMSEIFSETTETGVKRNHLEDCVQVDIVVEYAQDMPSQQSGDRKNMNKD